MIAHLGLWQIRRFRTTASGSSGEKRALGLGPGILSIGGNLNKLMDLCGERIDRAHQRHELVLFVAAEELELPAACRKLHAKARRLIREMWVDGSQSTR